MSNMKPWLVIQELERENGKIFKQTTIEVEAFSKNDEFFAGLMLALHPLTTFGVKQIPESTVAASDLQELPWSDFVALIDELIARNLTGHAARDAIHDMMLQSGQEQWNDWLRRILIQDMRAGFSESTVNKAVLKAKTPQYLIPVFKCMLAHDSKKHEKKVCGEKQIDVKLDGVRMLALMYKNGNVELRTRTGRPMTNFPHIETQLQRMTGDIDEDLVLDGEIMSADFQDLMQQLNRKTDVETGDAVLHVFDIIPLTEFWAGKSTRTQEERMQQLRALTEDDTAGDVSVLWYPNVKFLTHEVVDLDSTEGKVRFAEINKKALAGGYEGIMLKDPDALYECKRSANWLKLKPVITVDLTVTEIQEGTGKYEGLMGALVCEGNEDDKHIVVSVGSGFSDEQRAEFYDPNIVGQVVEIMADVITQSKDGDDYSLRTALSAFCSLPRL